MDQADAQFHFVLNQSPNNIPALLGKSFSATILGIFIFQHVPKMHLFVDSSLVTGLGSKVEELYLSKNKTSLGGEEAFLVVQWLRIHLPVQAAWVQSLVQEDSTCHGATKPVSPDY